MLSDEQGRPSLSDLLNEARILSHAIKANPSDDPLSSAKLIALHYQIAQQRDQLRELALSDKPGQQLAMDVLKKQEAREKKRSRKKKPYRSPVISERLRVVNALGDTIATQNENSMTGSNDRPDPNSIITALAQVPLSRDGVRRYDTLPNALYAQYSTIYTLGYRVEKKMRNVTPEELNAWNKLKIQAAMWKALQFVSHQEKVREETFSKMVKDEIVSDYISRLDNLTPYDVAGAFSQWIWHELYIPNKAEYDRLWNSRPQIAVPQPEGSTSGELFTAVDMKALFGVLMSHDNTHIQFHVDYKQYNHIFTVPVTVLATFRRLSKSLGDHQSDQIQTSPIEEIRSNAIDKLMRILARGEEGIEEILLNIPQELTSDMRMGMMMLDEQLGDPILAEHYREFLKSQVTTTTRMDGGGMVQSVTKAYQASLEFSRDYADWINSKNVDELPLGLHYSQVDRAIQVAKAILAITSDNALFMMSRFTSDQYERVLGDDVDLLHRLQQVGLVVPIASQIVDGKPVYQINAVDLIVTMLMRELELEKMLQQSEGSRRSRKVPLIERIITELRSKISAYMMSESRED